MAKNDLFYNNLKLNSLNKAICIEFEAFANSHPDIQLYLLSGPLGEKYTYTYESNGMIILSPGHKILFIDLNNGGEEFEDYVDDVISDVNSISDKYKYREHIGRAREWRNDLVYTTHEIPHSEFDIDLLLKSIELQGNLKRKSNLIISLMTGSINDINHVGTIEPKNILDRVKKKIVLFDGEQTRFIYKNFPIKKLISVQGLSGTGKTELLLHKLKDLYTENDSNRIFFTCHNIALADKLKQRIPKFFDFMKVDKQIKWNERLWMNRAWGSKSDPGSGLYSYICNYYNLTFYRYFNGINYQFIFSKALSEIKKIPSKDFQACFDYILIDESQDFPEIFFELCKKITKKKVYMAGDIFQDIFDSVKKTKRGVDIVLNRCYRTDPRTLMFAHAVGLGLFETKKMNWFDKSGWENLGYKTDYSKKGNLILSRLPIKRFEELETTSSVEIINNTTIPFVIEIIQKIKHEHSTLLPGDIAIILLDNDNETYKYIDKLCISISNTIRCNISRGFESKSATDDAIYITNPNNVKGLEFPFVICITKKILNTYRYRNSLYTMLTRSFLKSFLLVTDPTGISIQKEGLNYINEHRSIITSIPKPDEIQEIERTILDIQVEQSESYQDFLESIFKELGIISKQKQEAITKMLTNTNFDKFDTERVKQFINSNLEFL